MDKVDSSSPNITFSIENEDHTLGNAVRTLLVEREDVFFAGYSVPHPMQPEVNIRIQTTGKPAVKIFVECLDDLVEVCNVLTKAFIDAGAENYTDEK
ncbi:DNA-directed RNA polymerases family protein [Babesia bovis T2Bo]|uniref:RNA polymerase small subunit protein, putative n=1 Tax=Babesia bovis TaxID=5865 RepID=A7AT13_BABBO|nr:DNA-directed RNA polymerases family protein [Babesia bovis T2Bo]EDO06074.1 DNA-directed RNA polymerases family protein [Babesia bovis T2Bo]|eukprot:XP_001609642.1 RNA polymerase small subunit protein [Babesia bovis T2Bo]